MVWFLVCVEKTPCLCKVFVQNSTQRARAKRCSFGTMSGDQQSHGFPAIKGHYKDCVRVLSSHMHKPWIASSCISLCKEEHVVISFFNTLSSHIVNLALKHDHTSWMNVSMVVADVVLEVHLLCNCGYFWFHDLHAKLKDVDLSMQSHMPATNTSNTLQLQILCSHGFICLW